MLFFIHLSPCRTPGHLSLTIDGTVWGQINNTNVPPSFSGISGAGLYQINLTIPSGLGTGDKSLVATVGGVQTQSFVVIALQ